MTELHGRGKRSQEEAFRSLFSENYRAIAAYARRRVPNHDVDDIVGEVFATAWRRLNEPDAQRPKVERPLPWLYGIAGNVIRNRNRSEGRRLRLVESLRAEPVVPPSQDPAEVAAGDLRNALAILSFDDQEVLRLAAWEGLTHEEIGEILECSRNAVGIRLHRARQRLAEELSANSETSRSHPDINTMKNKQERNGD